ncbi:DNA-processing protein DprA [Serpentinicella alkaliphila]|uniref:DNA processing protein n=1 Tax=Serpentinicella alkaliphila TaxID=1734049 RepID=A0A4R2TSG2_9FIRM|nr:DNA-processing protein DprA [Serpentinicella alkaliphila]QUH26268.1 DNA-protecting protein DprA [Serpentinicella alkaliphila]TCQ05846.1 DNA processing protein [Serpentinicella alkaliphila]
MVNERNLLIWFSHVGNINYDVILNLKQYFGNLEEILLANEKHIYEALSNNRIIADKIIKNRSEKIIFSIIESINNKDFHIITINDKEYPKKLCNIYRPPYVLYCKGRIIEDIPMIAVVGSRKASAYGRWAAYNFSKELAEWGVSIVSGMALGIDAEGHKGAIAGAGTTVAVLGCGINTCYPPIHISLMDKIIERGTVLSEYPPNVLPLKHHFPARNRIISGLSDGIIVVEAAEKSGSLITVEHGLEQGKEIFALPGNINSNYSSGTNKLIKDGAKILLTVEDVLEEIRIKFPNIKKVANQKDYGELSKNELMVYNIIKGQIMHFDIVSRKSNLNINELKAILKVLEIKGYIKHLSGNMFTVIV